MSSEQADESDLEHLEDHGEDAYALVVKGNSMIENEIQDKDYVVIKPQSTCEIAIFRRVGNSDPGTTA